jgi:hypothetical protein
VLGQSRLDRPTFIIGCGRSGTTILGTVLSHHPAVTYLNEPRELWVRCTPAADIWSPEARARGGSLALGAAAASWATRRRLRRLLARRAERSGRPRLVEKLPINSFRLGFIDAALPDARYVHIVRDGVEVARSIAHWCRDKEWFGADDYKWQLLVAYAERQARYRDLPALCRDDYARGLLEWRLSEDAALEFLGALPATRHLQVRFEEFVRAPGDVLARIERFLDLEHSVAARRFVETDVTGPSRPPAAPPDPALTERIAGPLLRQLGYLHDDAAAASPSA